MDVKELASNIQDYLESDEYVDVLKDASHKTVLEMDTRIGWMEPLNCSIEQIKIKNIEDGKEFTVLVFSDDVIVEVKAKNAPRQIPSR